MPCLVRHPLPAVPCPRGEFAFGWRYYLVLPRQASAPCHTMPTWRICLWLEVLSCPASSGIRSLPYHAHVENLPLAGGTILSCLVRHPLPAIPCPRGEFAFGWRYYISCPASSGIRSLPYHAHVENLPLAGGTIYLVLPRQASAPCHTMPTWRVCLWLEVLYILSCLVRHPLPAIPCPRGEFAFGWRYYISCPASSDIRSLPYHAHVESLPLAGGTIYLVLPRQASAPCHTMPTRRVCLWLEVLYILSCLVRHPLPAIPCPRGEFAFGWRYCISCPASSDIRSLPYPVEAYR